MTKSEFRELANLYHIDKDTLKDELKTFYKEMAKDGVEPYAQFKKDRYKFKDLSSDVVTNLARIYFKPYEAQNEEAKEPIQTETEELSESQKLLNRLHTRDEAFDELELKFLILNYECDRINGENRRWTRTVSSIIKVKNEYFSIDWEEGLTECQENSYMNQPIAVKPVEKQVTVTEWVIDNDRLPQAEQKTEEPVPVPQNEEESVHSELDDEDEFDYDYE